MSPRQISDSEDVTDKNTINPWTQSKKEITPIRAQLVDSIVNYRSEDKEQFNCEKNTDFEKMI